MKKIVYYVATSLDGYIAGQDDDISLFAHDGNGVEKYLEELQEFSTTIMGRKTYEFGYQFGLEPGQPAYPHMQHHIFSSTLQFENKHPQVHVEQLSTDRILELKASSSTDIYLCGGGRLAGWLLDKGLIDTIKLKLNPIVLGSGTKLFSGSNPSNNWTLEKSESFDNGLMFLTYTKK